MASIMSVARVEEASIVARMPTVVGLLPTEGLCSVEVT